MARLHGEQDEHLAILRDKLEVAEDASRDVAKYVLCRRRLKHLRVFEESVAEAGAEFHSLRHDAVPDDLNKRYYELYHGVQEQRNLFFKKCGRD
jgi:hypothetical protein